MSTIVAARTGRPFTRPIGLVVYRRLFRAIRSAWPALIAYTVVRALGLASLYLWVQAKGKSFIGILGARSDGSWYMRIAQNGYDAGDPLQSDMAFFPLYPALVALIEPALPFGHHATALAISGMAGLAAAWGLFAVGNHLYGRAAGVFLAAVWGALPHAVVQSMAYTEGLFTALASWSLFALLNRKWMTAGTLCLLAGLTRPTASALIPVVGLAALIAIVRRQDGWRPWAAGILAPLGWLGYLAWVGMRMGRVDGWFHIQSEGWGSYFDGGRHTLETARRILTRPSALEFYMVTLIVLIAITCFLLSIFDHQPWQLLLFSGLMLVTTIGAAGYYHSKARFLLPAFTLLLPIAKALAATQRVKAYVIVGTLAAGSAYFGGYLLLIWPYSP
ncbi:MAG TPA: hypothetical protein VF174_02790 [Micromonosporaceae bacterium]